MRLKTYWFTLKNLFTSPKYYLQVLQAPLGVSFRFFIISIFILGLTLTSKVNHKLIPDFQYQAEIALDEAVTAYPVDLEIIWNGKILNSSSDKAIKIDYPSSIDKNSELPPALGYFIPADISSEQLSEKLDEESLFVVTSNNFFINNLQGIWTSSPLIDLFPADNITLNKDTIDELVFKLKEELAKILTVVKKLNFIVIPIGLIIFRFWMSFLEAILVFLFFKLNNFSFTFKKVMQLSLHLVVIAEIISQVTSWLYPNIQISMLTLAYWSIFSYIFWTQRKQLLELNIRVTPQEKS